MKLICLISTRCEVMPVDLSPDLETKLSAPLDVLKMGDRVVVIEITETDSLASNALIEYDVEGEKRKGYIPYKFLSLIATGGDHE